MKTQSVVVPKIQKNSKQKKQQPVGLHKGLLWGFKKRGYTGNREYPHKATENHLRIAGKVRVTEKQGEFVLAKGIKGCKKGVYKYFMSGRKKMEEVH